MNGGASGSARWRRWWRSYAHELLDNGALAAVSELGRHAAATAALRFRFGERESEREEESEGASEWKSKQQAHSPS